MIKGVLSLSLSLFVKAKCIGTTCEPLISEGFDNCFEHCRHCFESLFLLFFCSYRQSWQPIIWSQPQLGAWQYDNVTAVPRLSGRTHGLFHPCAFTVTSPSRRFFCRTLRTLPYYENNPLPSLFYCSMKRAAYELVSLSALRVRSGLFDPYNIMTISPLRAKSSGPLIK